MADTRGVGRQEFHKKQELSNVRSRMRDELATKNENSPAMRLVVLISSTTVLSGVESKV